MTPVFVDTSWFIALLSPRDSLHSKAVELRGSLRRELVTTWWVLVELFDGLAGSSHRARAAIAAERLLASAIRVLPLDERQVREGLDLFRRRTDKTWSLTDCISFAVMRELGLTGALTADRHFEQAGFVVLL